MKSTKFLIQEHKLILRALDVLDAMSASVEGAGKIDEDDADKILDFLRWFGDAHHQVKEETILFPALKSAAAAQDRPIQHMIHEHGQDRTMIEEMETAVRVNKLSEFVSCANKLSSTLRNHIYKEDDILFEFAAQVIDAASDEKVLDRLSRFETPLDNETLSARLQELRSLEWKYLRR
jgi:hemerythrin-like domain-containing protein